MRRNSWLTLLLLAGFILSACGSKATPAPATATASPSAPATLPPTLDPGKVVVGYYAGWAAAQRNYFVSNIPAEKLTHINYAFSNVSPDGKCILNDPLADVNRVYSAKESVNSKDDPTGEGTVHGNFNQLAELKQKYPWVKVLISVGGYILSENFSSAALTDASRQAFAASCIDLYLQQYKDTFDGIDLDWEYPVTGGLTANGRPEDKHNFTLLLAEFRRQLNELGTSTGKHYLLTIAASVGPQVDQRYERSDIAQYLDWINVMAYDFHGTWEKTTNFNAPLYQAMTDPSDASLNVDAVIQDYLTSGIPAEKLVLGVPFYGHIWKSVGSIDDGLYQASNGAGRGKFEEGSVYYTEIVQYYLPSYERFWQNESQVPWLYSAAGASFISYDDPQSIALKAGYAEDNYLHGVMVWELSQGDGEMLDAIQKGFEEGGQPHVVPTRNPSIPVLPRPFTAKLHQVGGIRVDGDLSDWTGDPTFTLNDASQLAYKQSTKSWAGPQDLSGQVWAGWAPEGLYFGIKLVDDIHLQTVSDVNIWHGDHVEFQFDTRLEIDYDRKVMNGDDYQIGVSAGDFAEVAPAAYAWFNGPSGSGLLELQQAQVKTPDGYILEVFFPKELLAGITMEENATFGMNVSLSDADSPTIGQKAMLSTSAKRTYADPTTFGDIILIK